MCRILVIEVYPIKIPHLMKLTLNLGHCQLVRKKWVSYLIMEKKILKKGQLIPNDKKWWFKCARLHITITRVSKLLL